MNRYFTHDSVDVELLFFFFFLHTPILKAVCYVSYIIDVLTSPLTFGVLLHVLDQIVHPFQHRNDNEEVTTFTDCK